MLNQPDIDYGMDVNPSNYNLIAPDTHGVALCRVIMQVFADEVLKYMHSKDAKIVLFAAQPSAIMGAESRPQKDKNGHRWPEYFFTKGHVRDAQGRNEVVAVPLRGALSEMLESEVLFYSV